jgi:hypothetical protein
MHAVSKIRFSQKLGREVRVATGKKSLPGTKTTSSNHTKGHEREPTGRRLRKRWRVAPKENGHLGQ